MGPFFGNVPVIAFEDELGETQSTLEANGESARNALFVYDRPNGDGGIGKGAK